MGGSTQVFILSTRSNINSKSGFGQNQVDANSKTCSSAESISTTRLNSACNIDLTSCSLTESRFGTLVMCNTTTQIVSSYNIS